MSAKKPNVDWDKFIDDSIAAEKAAEEAARNPRPSLLKRYVVDPIRRGTVTVVVAIACGIVIYGCFTFVASRLKPQEKAFASLPPKAPSIVQNVNQTEQTPSMVEKTRSDLPPSDFPSERPPMKTTVEPRRKPVTPEPSIASESQAEVPTQSKKKVGQKVASQRPAQVQRLPLAPNNRDPNNPPGPRSEYTWVNSTTDKNGVFKPGHWRKK